MHLQITGDNVLIARETARALGMGTDIRTAELLPQMMDDGRMPPHLGRDYGHIVLPADGFAQVQDLPQEHSSGKCLHDEYSHIHTSCVELNLQLQTAL